jgi:uncharacterized radical SAM superfamily protein
MTTEIKIDWFNRTLFLKESPTKSKPHLLIGVYYSGVTFKGVDIMFLLPDDKTATVVVSAVDAKGFTAQVEGVEFSSSDETIVTVDSAGVMTPVGIGSATINVVADALIGEGVEALVGLLEVTTVAGKAVSLNVTAVLS